MRKVSETIAHSFRAGQSKRVSNTETDGNTLRLHGNPIARRVGSSLEISLAGWPTNTTAERINTLLHVLGSGYAVGRKDRRPVIYGPERKPEPMHVSAWVRIPDVSL